MAWIEEASGVSESSWETLIPTVRAPGSELIINYNPSSADDPTHLRFAVDPPPNTLVDHFTFADNPFFGPALEAERAYLQRVDDDAYRHVWLGETRSHSDAQILKGKVHVDSFEPQAGWEPLQGLDFGFGDPTAAIRCYVADRTLFVSHECWALSCDIDAIPRLLDTIPDARRYVTRADSARPETISYLQRNGYPNVVAVDKWAGSVEDGVAHLRSYERVVMHPRCVHALEEARLYSFKTHPLTGDVLPTIKPGNDHLMDSLRYALQPAISRPGGALLDFYRMELQKDAATDADPTAWRRRALSLQERARREGAVIQEMTSPWHRP